MWGREGERAGWVNNNGYRYVRINGKAYKAHRLIWLFVHGSFPKGNISHKNYMRDDNRISNLIEQFPPKEKHNGRSAPLDVQS